MAARFDYFGIRICKLILLAICVSGPGTGINVVADDPPAATNMAQAALNMQNAGDFKTAAETWEKLLAQFPDTTLTGTAQYNAGVCHVQTGNYKSAIAQLKSSLSSLDKNKTANLTNAQLFLGFSQARFGQQLLEEQPDEGKQWLTNATKTLAVLLQQHPEFGDADQACFFQGEAFELLGQLKDAAASYEKMQTFKNQTFKYDGLFALANVYEQLADYDKALKHYEMFQTSAEADGGHELMSEVSFRTGETILQLATAAQTAGEIEKANSLFNKAEKLYAQATADEQFPLRDLALFQQAFCAGRGGKALESAALYQAVAQVKDSEFRDRALTYAGRELLNAGKGDDAVAALKQAVAAESEFSAEAAHWLAQVFLRSTSAQAEQAFQLADQWIKKSPDHPFHVNLMLDRADAAYLLDARRAESPALFLEIADKHPDHALAPSAIYNAAFAELEVGNFKKAIELSNRFEQKYADDDYLPDTLEVKADASLLDGQAGQAEQVFRTLATKYPANEKSDMWTVRAALAAYMQKNFDGTLKTLTPVLAKLRDPNTAPELKAEALHLIGSCHLNDKKWTEATQYLTESITADPKWRRADETLFNLAQSHNGAGESEKAAVVTTRLINEFPKSPFIAQARYRVGELAYQENDFPSAIENYQAVITNHPKTEFVPYALYGVAWSHVKLKEFEKSISQFTELIDQFPEHDLANRARVGRGASLRQSGKPAQALVDINQFLGSEPTGQVRMDAMYELGLAQLDSQDWKAAIKTFNGLIADDPDSKLADRYHYELAWALNSDGDKQQSLAMFASIINKFPESSIAPEANFHVGNDAYDNEKYDEAIKHFQICLDSKAVDSLREKSAYKLAWSHYKTGQFDKSLAAFQNQVKQFPTGPLNVDGNFMIAESMFRKDDYEGAFAAYVAAKPGVDGAKNIDPKIPVLTRLHGSHSANKIKKFNEALELAEPVTQLSIEQPFKDDAWFQVGTAHKGLGESDKAIEAWQKAALNTGKTGARARCMIGDVLFEQKKFDDATKQFKLVFYGFGGTNAADDVKPLQAYAVYECALCSYVQIKEATPEQRPDLIKQATDMFQYLLDNYPEDTLVKQTRENLATLKKLADSQN